MRKHLLFVLIFVGMSSIVVTNCLAVHDYRVEKAQKTLEVTP